MRHEVRGNSVVAFGVMGTWSSVGVMGEPENAERVCLRLAVLPRGHRELGGLWVRKETREILERMDET